MASTLTKNLLHITFSTKGRANLIPSEFEEPLFAYIGGICRNLHSRLVAAGGTSNHVHLLIDLAKTVSLADLMLNLKRDSSRWFHQQGPALESFAWQGGYFAFSVGESSLADVCAYFARQKPHHNTVDFRDEVREFLKRYNIEYDDRYVWE